MDQNIFFLKVCPLQVFAFYSINKTESVLVIFQGFEFIHMFQNILSNFFDLILWSYKKLVENSS